MEAPQKCAVGEQTCLAHDESTSFCHGFQAQSKLKTAPKVALEMRKTFC